MVVSVTVTRVFFLDGGGSGGEDPWLFLTFVEFHPPSSTQKGEETFGEDRRLLSDVVAGHRA